MLGLLAAEGYVPVSDPRGADMVIINTCGFIESARQESRAVIHEMTELKRRGEVGGVIVTGCLAERVGEQLITEIPLIDQAVGVFGREEIARVAERFLNGATEQRTLFRPAPVRALDDTARLRVTPRHYAYLKISEGCDRTCTFCAIPRMRGKHVTKPIEQVLAEARELIDDGVRELILVSQDTTYYGIDRYGKPRLADLLRQLDRLDGLEWIRILYAYPEHIDDRLIETMADAQRIVPYLDLPLQHINDRILKRMQRRVNRAQTEALLEKLRSGWPGVVLRTTFIVGFPGENDAQFDELVEFVRSFRFERLGVFTYSFEEGTPATRLDGHLADDVKHERRDRLMQEQQEVAFDLARRKVDTELVVIVDEADSAADRLRCRSAADAPDIDTNVFVSGTRLRPGQILRVRVTGADGYDLIGKPIGSPW
jgi:ribosomal protein S12 methylthiotransferase